MVETNNVLNRANAIVQKLLLGSYIESYGVSHQVHFIDFRNDSSESRLTFDIDLQISPVLDNDKLTSSEQILIAMDRANLHQVISVECTDSSTLIIQFDGEVILSFAGNSGEQNVAEPWQITSDDFETKILLIALQGGGYAIWE